MTIATPHTQATSATEVAEVRFSAIGTTAVLLVTAAAAAAAAAAMLRADLAELDRACSRFRADSEIRGLQHTAGSPVRVSPLLADILDTALRAAHPTDGVVDPTVGAAMVSLGYDRDFAALDALEMERPAVVAAPAPGWWRIGWDPRSREILLPYGIALDVGATAKALAADRAAARSPARWAAGCWSVSAATSLSPDCPRRAAGGYWLATTTPAPTLTVATASRSCPVGWRLPGPADASGAAARQRPARSRR